MGVSTLLKSRNGQCKYLACRLYSVSEEGGLEEFVPFLQSPFFDGEVYEIMVQNSP